MKEDKVQTEYFPATEYPDFLIISKEEESDSEFTPPGIRKMFSSVSKSAVNWAKSGFQTASNEQFNERLEICKKCDFWDGAALADTGRCKKCGCSTMAKLKMATEKCPIDKW